MIIVVFALAALGAVTEVGSLAAPPKLREACLTPKERAAAVSFRSTDGARLVGVMLGSGSRGVVLSHEFDADLCSWLPYGRTLAAKGYRVLAIDLRGFGSSGRPPVKTADRFDLDVGAAVKLLRRTGARRIALAGGSIGGAATLVAGAAVQPKVDAVVSVSSPAGHPGLDALVAVQKLRAPVLFVHAKRDPFVPVSDAQRLYKAAVGRDKRLAILPGYQHGSGLLIGTGGAKARRILDAFIQAHLGS
jgi:pimeloyl-ACP methyl ester carboxylesterase